MCNSDVVYIVSGTSGHWLLVFFFFLSPPLYFSLWPIQMDTEDVAPATEENGGPNANAADPKANGEEDVNMDAEKQASDDSKPKPKKYKSEPVDVTVITSLDKYGKDLEVKLQAFFF